MPKNHQKNILCKVQSTSEFWSHMSHITSKKLKIAGKNTKRSLCLLEEELHRVTLIYTLLNKVASSI